MPKNLILFLPSIVFILIGLMAASLLARGPAIHHLQSPMVNVAVPDFKAETFDSETLKGKVTILNFFASWCAPCEGEHPAVLKLSKTGVSIYGIDYEDDPAKRTAFLNRLGNPYKEIADDKDGRIALAFGVTGTPTTMIVDRNGIIRYRLDMPVTDEEMDKVILPLAEKLQQ